MFTSSNIHCMKQMLTFTVTWKSDVLSFKVWMQVNLVPLMKPIPNQNKAIGVRRVKVVPAFGTDLMLLPDWSTGLLPQTTTKHLQVSDMDSIISFKTKKTCAGIFWNDFLKLKYLQYTGMYIYMYCKYSSQLNLIYLTFHL